MVEILGLPKGMRTIPNHAPDWETWRDRALVYRMQMRDLADRDEGARKHLIEVATDDPLYDFVVFGATFEPRNRPDRPKGWYPLIPYAFQGELIRWIEDVIAADPRTPSALLGRGDGVLEKARGMAGTVTICGFLGNRWRFDDGFVGGVMSYKEDVVEKTMSTDTIFYKIEGYLGLDARVPEFRDLRVGADTELVPIRSPGWLIPEGYDPNLHNLNLSLANPTTTNVINGYSTSGRTGVGARLTVLFMDEAAKFQAFGQVWQSTSATTDHRIAISSADIRYGTGFRDLARVAEHAQQSGGNGPAFLRLRPEAHPERDELWREEIESRHAGGEQASEALAREYDLDYDAGGGAFIYPRAKEIVPVALSFNPANEMLDFCIDPGIRDMTAFHAVKVDPGLDRYGLLLSYASSGQPAEFYASLVMGQPLAGYDYGEEEERVMAFFLAYGPRVRFWIGDPAGKARGGGKATSFYQDFREATRELSDGKRAISIWSSDKSDYKHLRPRHSALRWLISKLDINDAPDTRRTLAAIQDHRFPARKDDREVTSEPDVTVRTWGHDRVTALEFYAAHRKLGGAMQVAAETANTTVQRVSISGRPYSSRKKAGYVTR